MNDRVFRYLWLIPLALFCNRITSWLPEYDFIDPFPFHQILDENGQPEGITLQAYWYMLAIHLGWIILWVREVLRKDKYSLLFKWFLVIEALSLADFFLRFEKSFTTWGMYEVEFTDFKIVAYVFCIALYKRKLWKTSGN